MEIASEDIIVKSVKNNNRGIMDMIALVKLMTLFHVVVIVKAACKSCMDTTAIVPR